MSQLILAIDPGPEMSAWVIMSFDKVFTHDYSDNFQMIPLIGLASFDVLVIEDVKSYGMPVGDSVFAMCKWMGRFEQKACKPTVYLPNAKIRATICKSTRAKDPHIRRALMDRYGGDRSKSIGTKANPGPLYGITGHVWSALAVGVTYLETR